eukprot:TRINITY_DN21164_c0_g1_i1.p1 TRINITY_DN21164_c0_g1~~TRINITY_DN21164_c0_g1_i1.p1  ORF type:complete len:309 (+),score=29.00 TRINITY_DN21164_c0_g1_i1:52-927(+)
MPYKLAIVALVLYHTATHTEAKIAAVGDLHGDYEKAVRVLQMTGLVGEDLEWKGRDGDLLVQTGDIIDRGPDARRIYKLFERLKQETEATGGEVVNLMGNHELMNLQGMISYAHQDEVTDIGGKDARRQVFSPQGEWGQALLKLPKVIRRGPYVFVHAGLLPHHVTQSIESLDEQLTLKIATGNFLHPLLHSSGPLWTRDPIQQAARGDCSIITSVLSTINSLPVYKDTQPVTSIVVGHTIQGLGRIGVHCKGRIIGIDIALSKYISSRDYTGYADLTNSSRPTGVYSVVT